MGVYGVNAPEKFPGDFLTAQPFLSEFNDPEFGKRKYAPRHKEFLVRWTKVASSLTLVGMKSSVNCCWPQRHDNLDRISQNTQR